MELEILRTDIEKEFKAERKAWLKKFSRKTAINALFYGLFVLMLSALDAGFNKPSAFEETYRICMAILLLIVMAPFNAWLSLPFPPTRDKTERKIRRIMSLKKTHASSALNEHIHRISTKQVLEETPGFKEHLKAFNWIAGDNIELRKIEKAYVVFEALQKAREVKPQDSAIRPLP